MICYWLAKISQIQEVKMILKLEFHMMDLRNARRILGMEIVRNGEDHALFLSQKGYLEKVLKRFSMENSKPISIPLARHFRLSMTQCLQFEVERNEMDFVPYVNAIGSLMYAMVCSRLDIAHSVSVLSRFMANLGREHWNGFKWLLRYVRGSLGVGLKFGSSKEGVGIIGYVDLDYARDLDKRRSTTSYIFILFGGPVSSKSQLQSIAALSTTEAKYTVATEAMKEPLWLQGLVKELGVLNSVVDIFSDSHRVIQLCKNPVFHERTKQVDVRYHFIRETVSSGAAKLEKISTPDNPANMATKVLLVSKFKYCMDLVQVMCNSCLSQIFIRKIQIQFFELRWRMWNLVVQKLFGHISKIS